MDSLCLQPLFLRILYLCGVFLRVICYGVPILLIIKLIIDIYKKIINPEDTEIRSKIINRIVACIIIFFVPTIVSVLFSLIESVVGRNSYNDIAVCREFANIEHIEVLEQEITQEQIDAYNNEKSGNLSEYEKKINAVRKMVEENKNKSSTDNNDSINYNDDKNNVDNSTPIGKGASKSNMIACGSGSKYNKELYNMVKSAGYKTRAGVVAAAIYLSSKIDVHIPYFSTGGHRHTYAGYADKGENFIGVSNKWGCNVVLESGETDKQKKGVAYPFGMDCSGFVNWAILTGGYYIGDSSQYVHVKTGSNVFSSIEDIKVSSVSAKNAKGKIKPGDIAFKSGHVGLVIGVYDDRYVVAEEMGYDYGLVVSELTYGKRFTDIVLMDNFYSNYQKNRSLWDGFK